MTATDWYRIINHVRLRWNSLKSISPEAAGGSGVGGLAYFDTGAPRSTKSQGAPILLFHGFTADKESWLGLARRLRRNHRLVAVDLVGHGKSPEAAHDMQGGYGVGRQADRAHQLVERLVPALGSHHVLGHSMGGGVAIKYAVAFPDEILSLGLIAPAAARRPHTAEFHRHMEGEARPPSKVNPLIVSKGDAAIEWSGADRVGYVTNGPRRLHALARLFDSHLTEIGLERTELDRDIFQELTDEPPIADDEFRQIQRPTFILWGADDRVLTPDPCYIMSRMPVGIPVRLQVWGGVGHSPQIEKPRRTAEAYRAFLDGLGSPASPSSPEA